MKLQQLSVDDALASLGSTRRGLATAEAAKRLGEFGPNRVEPVGRTPWWWRLLQEFTHFFALILWVAVALALWAEWNSPGQGMARIALALVVVIVVSGLFSFWQEYRIEQTLAALQKLLPQQVEALRDGALVQLPIEQLVPGDVIRLDQGDTIPADCRLIEAFAVRVNNATVTGEAASLRRDAEPDGEETLLHSRNILLAGTALVAGQGQAVVFATGARTEFGQIAHLTQTGREPASPLRRQLARLSRLIARLAVGIGLLFFAIGALLGTPFWQNFMFAIGLIVAMVPEGLLPTLTLALVLAAQRMARRHVLIRHLPSVETLGSATVICTDKTGTLTQNRMQVRELLLGLRRCGVDAPAGPDATMLLQAVRQCHELTETQRDGRTVLLGDPMEVALVELARRWLPAEADWPRLDMLPFDAGRMRQAVVVASPDGPMLLCKGAPEAVLPLCTHIRQAARCDALDEPARRDIVAAQDAMASQGLRVLAVAVRPLPADWRGGEREAALTFVGLVALEDPPRPEVPEAVRRCHDAGIKIIMVTGDHAGTATAIAREIGLLRTDAPVVIDGERLRHLSATQLQIALDAPDILFVRLAADQKLRIVEALKRKRHVVAVTGDGVNDAPALKAAHIGIAMGLNGTDVAKAAADMILLDDNFASIVVAVEEGRAVFQNIRKFLTYVLVHNVAELVPYLAFALLHIPLPLTPIQALSIDMGTDTLTALGLGVEKPSPDAMRQPPRPAGEPLLNRPLMLRAYLFLGVIEAAAGMATFFFVLDRGGWRFGQALAVDAPLYLQATTACLGAIIALQMVNVFLCRSARRSVFSMHWLDNRLIVGGVGFAALSILFIVYSPWGNALFGTAPLDRGVWLFILPFAGLLLALEEARKWWVRRRGKGLRDCFSAGQRKV